MSFLAVESGDKIADEKQNSLHVISEGEKGGAGHTNGRGGDYDGNNDSNYAAPLWKVSGGISEQDELEYIRGQSYRHKKGPRRKQLSLRTAGHLFKNHRAGKRVAFQERERCAICGWLAIGLEERKKSQTRFVTFLLGRERPWHITQNSTPSSV